jgi:hypothetical protein
MIIKVTSPQAPRVLPVTDPEIAQAAQQLYPQPAPLLAPRRASGCLVAALIIFGIISFFSGAFYGVFHPICPQGEMVRSYPVEGTPVFVNPKCLSNGVLSEPEREYIFPAGGVVSTVLLWGGTGMFLWGCILPIVRWFRDRAAREQWRAQAQAAANDLSARQQALSWQVGQARQRVFAAYYCGRDDGFFIPGQAGFFPRSEWLHFLFG